MSKKDKLIKRLKSKPSDFTYEELKTLLNYFEFFEYNKGKTSGSAVKFHNYKFNREILLHKPHPENILKEYQIKQIINILEKMGVI